MASVSTHFAQQRHEPCATVAVRQKHWAEDLARKRPRTREFGWVAFLNFFVPIRAPWQYPVKEIERDEELTAKTPITLDCPEAWPVRPLGALLWKSHPKSTKNLLLP